jgi:putative flavoprotein involved in K+ transport
MGAAGPEVAIVGAGPAGLATAHALVRRGVRPVIFEAGDRPGCAWRLRYDRLRLHTARWLSGQPGLGIPRRDGPWVAANALADYLERYARRDRLEIVTGTKVTAVVRDGTGWRLETSRGVRSATAVVVAAGFCRSPKWPAWAGAASFEGTLLHASEYRNAQPFAGREVLVIGCGNSGAEIAMDLALGGARRVCMSIRSGPFILPRALFGIPTHAIAIPLGPLPGRLKDAIASVISRLWIGDLARYGLPRPSRGLFARMQEERVAPVLDTGFVSALAAGKIEIVAGVDTVSGRQVCLEDGTGLTPDAVIAATGFNPDLDQLIGAAVALEDRGLPRLSRHFEAETAPGLYLAGYVVAAEGVLWTIAKQSRRIATAIARRRR